MSQSVLGAVVVVVLVMMCGDALAACTSSLTTSGDMTYPATAWMRYERSDCAYAYALQYYNPDRETFRILGDCGGDPSVGIHVRLEIPMHADQTNAITNTLNITSDFVDAGIAIQSSYGKSRWGVLYFSPLDVPTGRYYASGDTQCVANTQMYVMNDTGSYYIINETSANSYNFTIMQGFSYRLLFDSVYYDFTCDGNEVFDYDACIWVYGYTCGVDNIKLYNDSADWVLDDSVGQSTGYDIYEMPIVDGEDYKISFIDSTIDGDFVVHNQTFSCTGDHVLIDFDRCEWIYPISPPAPPYVIYLWTGYDYNIVVFKDAHGNFIENSQLAIYDMTDSKYLQRWTDASNGYALLGAKFATDHDVRLSIRTFDGIFTLDTTFPANGSAAVGEEDITTTNWTIPIKYNLNVLPVDQYGVSLFDVFCGLSEYTPLNPGAFWGMDLSDQGYVAVTNCSGFAMCDIIAEKEGYADYKVEALNWTSKSALVKDYRHNIVMEEE